jgi:tRNA threonylcarbamoyladenosine biosynthesis protein TsaB
LKLLAIDTSTRYASVALVNGSHTAERTWRSEQNHGMELMPAIDAVLRDADVSAAGITHLAVAVGPGGFSALRVGISTAIGLSLPRNLTATGVSTFDIEAAPWTSAATPERPVCVLIPAGRTDLYWARYEGMPQPSATGVASPHGLADIASPETRFCGEAAYHLAGLLSPGSVISGPPPTRSPLTVARLGAAQIEQGLGVPAADLRPYYLREPSITAPRNR